ncbi:MAG: hypothetical protein WA206_02945, partial [Candidatus Binatus sp.]
MALAAQAACFLGLRCTTRTSNWSRSMSSPRLRPTETMSSRKPIGEAELERLQNQSFSYFLHETNPDNGLVIDKTASDWPASIAATGFALAAYPVAVERGFMPRAAAVKRTLTTLR